MSQVHCELWDDNLTCMFPMCSLHAPAWSHHVLQNYITYPILISNKLFSLESKTFFFLNLGVCALKHSSS